MLLVSLIIFFFLVLNYGIRGRADDVLFFFQDLWRCLGCLRLRIEFYRIFFGHFCRSSRFFEWRRFIKFCSTLFAGDWIRLGSIGAGTSLLRCFFHRLRRSSSIGCLFTVRVISFLFLSTRHHGRQIPLVFFGHLLHQMLGLTEYFRPVVDYYRKVILLVPHQLVGGRDNLGLENLPLFLKSRYQWWRLFILLCRWIDFLISYKAVRGVIWGT